jgi:thiol-disulfide isomerase/thioredoxin
MVPELSPETFNATIKRPASLGNNAVWVVEFYSDRCPFCKVLSPQVVEAAEKLAAQEGARIMLGVVNSRIYYEVFRSFFSGLP